MRQGRHWSTELCVEAAGDRCPSRIILFIGTMLCRKHPDGCQVGIMSEDQQTRLRPYDATADVPKHLSSASSHWPGALATHRVPNVPAAYTVGLQ